MLFQLAAIAIKGMDVLIVGLLGLKAFSSWNLSPEFYMEANVLWSTLIQAVDRKAIAQSVVLCFLFSIIYPETVKLIYREILDWWNLFLDLF